MIKYAGGGAVELYGLKISSDRQTHRNSNYCKYPLAIGLGLTNIDCMIELYVCFKDTF